MPHKVRAFLLILVSVCFAVAACGRASLDGYDLTLDGGLIDASGDAPFDVSADARDGALQDGDAAFDGEAGACNATTCANGCCDANGQCVTGNTLTACGGGGALCEDCLAQKFDFCDAQLKTCARDVSTCNASTCGTGCCQAAAPRCLSGESDQACGDNGSACAVCPTGQSCNTTTHKCELPAVKCDSTNCDGCCDAAGICRVGQDNSACGVKGQTCAACASGTTCGPVGPVGGICEGPAPCGPETCNGCCIGDICSPGTQNTACGLKGDTCVNCTSSNQVCNASTCANAPPQCNPQNCPNGCCNGTTCVAGTAANQCGTGGQACQNCGAGATCTAQTCQATCNATTCPNGCCAGNSCVDGNAGTACGTGGALCQNCSVQGEACQNKACQAPACNAATCPTGCCNGNTCIAGNSNTLCGLGGVACQNCTAQGNICSTQQSCIPPCNATNCPGCCDSVGVCNAGFVNNKCGSAGATCSNCTSQNATCSIASVPRVCSNQTTTCPSSYGTCAAGVTTPVLPNQAVCTASELADARAACSPGVTSASCDAYFSFIQSTAPSCGACLAPFRFAFADGTGLFNCVAPFVSSACNHNTGCAVDCTTQSCSQCPAANESQCDTSVRGAQGQCRTEFASASCFTQGLSGAGSFCNPVTYQGNYGRWLEGVGLNYCAP